MVKNVSMNLGDTLELDYLIEQISNDTPRIKKQPNNVSDSLDHIRRESSVFKPSSTGIYKIDIDGQIVEIEVVDIPDSGDLQNPDIYYAVTEGSGTSLSDEQGTIDGTVNGATWESGEGVGDAYLSLDGNDDSTRTNSDLTPSLQDSRAFAAWVRPDTTNSTSGSLAHGNTRNNNELIHYRFRSGNIQFGNFTSEGTVTGLSFSAGTWHLCVATFDSSTGTGYAYIAAVGDSSPSSISTSMTFNDVTGKMFWGSELGNGFYLPGDIDILLFYNRHLSSNEISDLFDNTKSLYQ